MGIGEKRTLGHAAAAGATVLAGRHKGRGTNLCLEMHPVVFLTELVAAHFDCLLAVWFAALDGAREKHTK